MPRILIIDNYDSFTFNLVHLVQAVIHQPIDVWQNDQITWDQVDAYDKIILSPGPGLPEEAGDLVPFIKRFAEKKSILGVCLGHQALAVAFGGRLKNLNQVCHGVSVPMQIVHKDPLYQQLDSVQWVGRYHSWVVDAATLPSCFTITAVDDQQHIMSMRHESQLLTGLQYHPESILTPNGRHIISRWLST